jgi:transposase-like protein
MARGLRSLHFKQEAVAMAKATGSSINFVAETPGVRPENRQYWIDHPPEYHIADESDTVIEISHPNRFRSTDARAGYSSDLRQSCCGNI